MKRYNKHITAGLLFSALLVSSCVERKVVINREVDTAKYGKMLLGPQALSQFENESYATWYHQELDNYVTDKNAIAQLKKRGLSSYQIVIFLGTWCEDSHREFPRLVKILQEANYPLDKLQIIGLNRKRESPEGDEGLYGIQRVPTIILKKYGREIGRIVETPSDGWIERDLLRMIENNRNSGVRSLVDHVKGNL